MSKEKTQPKEKAKNEPVTQEKIQRAHKRIKQQQENILLSGASAGVFFDEKTQKFIPAKLSTSLQRLYNFVSIIDNGDLYVYNVDTGLYEKYGEEFVEVVVKKALRDRYFESRAKSVASDIKACTYIEREKFDNTPIHLIPVENGILDISKYPAELIPYNEKYYFISKLPVTYDPKAECPKFLKFLSEIMLEEKYRLQIQEMFGWCLWRDYNYQNTFMLVGEGSNGRSVLLGVLRALLGVVNVSSISLQELCESRFAKAQLYQKFANIAPDIPSVKIEDSSTFKNLTGGDLLTAEEKFRHPFQYINVAKLIFSANKLPGTKDTTYAFYRRWMLIFFNIRFGGDGLPEDKNILKKITTFEELSGILNWALEGLKRLNEQGDFTGRMSVAETERYYRQLSYPAYKFLDERITETGDAADYIPRDYIQMKFAKYCKVNRLPPPKSKTPLTRAINRTYNKRVSHAQRAIGGKPRAHVWTGCKFTSDVDNLDMHMFYDGKTKPSKDCSFDNVFKQ